MNARPNRNVGISALLHTMLLGWATILGVIFFAVRSCVATPGDPAGRGAAGSRAAVHHRPLASKAQRPHP